jgi:TonB family protein
VFDEMLRKEGARRLARRSAYLAGSSAVQVAATMALAALFAAAVETAPRHEPAPVEVKFVKGAPRPATPPPAPAPRKTARAQRPATPPQPVAPLVQPREVAEHLPAPGPPEPPPPEEPAGGPGVTGGVVGGAEEVTAPAPAARPVFDAASMTRPVFVSGPDPAYTRAALDREVEGLMVVACVVTREGRVRDCQVLQGLPFMDAAVVQALERRRYRPATLGGEPIEVTYHFRLNLRLPR